MTSRQLGWPAFTALSLSAAIVIVAIHAVSVGAPRSIALLLASLSATFALILIQAYRSAEGLLSTRGIFATFFWLTFVGRPLQMFREGRSLWFSDLQMIEPYLVFALVLVQLGTLAYLAGYRTASGRLAERLPAPAPLDRRNVSLARLMLLIAIGLAAMALLVGDPAVWLSRLFFRRELLEGRFYLYAVALILPFALLLWAGLSFTCGQRLGGAVLVLVAAAAMSLFGGRATVVLTVFTGAVLYDRHVRRLGIVTLAVLGCAVALFLAAYLEFRVSARGQGTASVTSTQDPSNMFDSTLTAGFTGVDRLIVLLDGVPRSIPFQYGATYVRIVTAPIPRRWWPDKPGISEATVYAPLFGTATGMYPASYVGDLYLNGHVIAVLIGMWLMGAVHRLLDAWRSTYRENASATTLYAIAALTVGAGLGNVGIVNTLLMSLPFLAVTFGARRWGRSAERSHQRP